MKTLKVRFAQLLMGLVAFLVLAGAATPASAQVVVRVGPHRRYHHRYYRHYHHRHYRRY